MDEEIKCGIYKIFNIKNQKIYVGRSIDINRRWRVHKYFLDNNKHCNKDLQKDWILFKESNFNFEIIEICKEIETVEKEVYWIDKLNAFTNGYNKNIGNGGGYSKYKLNVLNNIVILYKNKYSTPEVSKMLNIPLGTIKDIISSNGLSRNHKDSKQIHYEKNTIFTDELINTIILLYQNGETCASIANIFKTNRTSINDYLKANGIILRNKKEAMRNTYKIKYSDQEVLELLEKNTYDDVQKITKLSKTTLLKMKYDNGKIVNSRIKITDEEKKNIINDFNNGMSITKMKKKYKRRDITIKKIIYDIN